VVRHLQGARRVPVKAFVLTFDDGYQDVHSKVLPILEKFGFTATIFLVAGRMGSPSNWAGQEGARAGLLLSWAEARDLARRGLTLGSHTLSHPRLSLLDDPSACEEIRNSRVLIEDQLDMQVDFFSYPYSDCDARIERLVESAGYTAACAGDSGPWSVFHLWRAQCVRDDTIRSFALKASGWYHRRISLRESSAGRFFRRGIRKLRHRSMVLSRRPMNISNDDLGRESSRGS
jgi:peptidoglycan/xylan/chitin deacetylase (PgdA/CDA1 family)